MLGINKLLAFLRQTVGLGSDAADIAGGLHGKLRHLYTGGGLIVLYDGRQNDITFATNKTLDSGVYCFRDLVINAGITVTPTSSFLVIIARNITMAGLLSASGKGAAGGAAISGTAGNGNPGSVGIGPGGGGGGGGEGNATYPGDKPGGAGGKTFVAAGGAGGSGGAGGAGGAASYIGFASLTSYLELFSNIKGGGGGSGGNYTGGGTVSGAGGAGAGCIAIFCDILTIDSGGAIRANGINGANASGTNAGGGGGGGGGAVLIGARQLINNGAVSAAGGSGGTKSGSGTNGGAGGAGYILQQVG